MASQPANSRKTRPLGSVKFPDFLDSFLGVHSACGDPSGRHLHHGTKHHQAWHHRRHRTRTSYSIYTSCRRVFFFIKSHPSRLQAQLDSTQLNSNSTYLPQSATTAISTEVTPPLLSRLFLPSKPSAVRAPSTSVVEKGLSHYTSTRT